MEKTGAHIIGSNVARHDSTDAQKAYKVIARQTDSLDGGRTRT